MVICLFDRSSFDCIRAENRVERSQVVFEKAAVLFLIAAQLASSAAAEKLGTDTSCKQSAKLFQVVYHTVYIYIYIYILEVSIAYELAACSKIPIAAYQQMHTRVENRSKALSGVCPGMILDFYEDKGHEHHNALCRVVHFHPHRLKLCCCSSRAYTQWRTRHGIRNGLGLQAVLGKEHSMQSKHVSRAAP